MQHLRNLLGPAPSELNPEMRRALVIEERLRVNKALAEFVPKKEKVQKEKSLKQGIVAMAKARGMTVPELLAYIEEGEKKHGKPN